MFNKKQSCALLIFSLFWGVRSQPSRQTVGPDEMYERYLSIALNAPWGQLSKAASSCRRIGWPTEEVFGSPRMLPRIRSYTRSIQIEFQKTLLDTGD